MSPANPPFYDTPESAFMIFFTQAFMLVCLFFALIYDVRELTLFTLLLLIVGLITSLWRRVSLRQVECIVEPHRRKLFPNEKLRIEIKTINSKFLPILFKFHLFVPKSIADANKGRWITEEMGLLWFQQSIFSREFFPSRRGVYDLGPPLLRAGDLFGFYSKQMARTEKIEIVVYPRIVEVQPIEIPKREFFGIPGAQSPVEDPVFVFGTRDYQTGRPARRIHWKASARFNRLQEKLCEPAEQEKVLFILDVGRFESEQAFDSFETVLEAIASLVLRLDRKGLAVGLVTNGKIVGGGAGVIPISRSPQQPAAILEALARVEIQKTGRVTEILSKGYSIPWGTSGIFFACYPGHGVHLAGAYLKNSGIPIRYVMAQKPNDLEKKGDLKETETLYLDQILASK